MDPSRTKPALIQRIQQTPLVYYPQRNPSASPLSYNWSDWVFSSVNTAPRVPKGIRGRGRGRGRSGPSGAGRRPKKTVEDLDQEMADYYQDGVTTSTTTT